MTAEDAAADFDRGAAERAAGNTDAAREAFRRAAASGHPDLGPKALANLAVLEARAVYLRAIEGGDGPTAARARSLLHDLGPDPDDPDPTISLGTRHFQLSEIEDAEWALGRPPTYSSGHLDVYTRDGGHHVVYVDLRDPYDRRGVDALRRHLGPGRL